MGVVGWGESPICGPPVIVVMVLIAEFHHLCCTPPQPTEVQPTRRRIGMLFAGASEDT